VARLNLLGGTYLARSLITSVEQCINLYPEKNPQAAASPYTMLLTPGLTFRRAPLAVAPARGLYTATNGSLYYVCGNAVYFIDPNFNITQLGTLGSNTGAVFMQDNGNVLVIADGSAAGYAINLQTGIVGQPAAYQVTNSGSGGTAGTYTIPLSGGTGTGASITLTVAGSTATVVSVTGGLGYSVGDTLTLGSSITGLSGFALVLTAVGGVANAFAAINDPYFLGGSGIGYVDTFLVLSQPNSRNFYSSLSNITYVELTSGTSGQPQLGTLLAGGTGGTNGTYTNVPLTGGSGTGATATLVISGGAVTTVTLDPTGEGYQPGDIVSAGLGLSGFQYELVQLNNAAFNPTYVAAKTGYPDLLATLVTVHREIWLLGAFETTEIWYDAGNAGFPFAIMPGVFLQHGCIAPASVATHDLDVFWLGVDNAGQGTVFLGTGYTAKRISDWSTANLISQYLTSAGTISDAVGLVYKQQDHVFYVLTFPTANATLVYDLTEGLWHQRTWTDPNAGTPNRVRYNVAQQCYGLNVVADWQTGNIYTLDINNYTDNGNPIVRTRYFSHILNDGKRQSYDCLRLDLQCGQGYIANPTQVPLVTLMISDDRGQTFYNAPQQSMGQVGDYLAQPQWRQLGQARDRVFGVTWSEGVFTALQGAWLDATPAET
jgi:hypothetical protein